MKGLVTKLCDVDSIAIPAEMLSVHVDDAQVAQEVSRLSLRYAKESPAEAAQDGDLVCCRAKKGGYADGRRILLYPGVQLPGAEQAAKAALGAHAGDSLETTLCGNAVALTVEKILHRTPVEVNDALIASLGITGVKTVAQYHTHLHDKMLSDLRMERSKDITRFLMDRMIADSDYLYDEAEMEEYIRSTEEEIAAQEDMEGLTFSSEEMRQAIADQAKQGWMAEAFCEAHGLKIDEAEVQVQADQMEEMMRLTGEEVPARAELLEMTRQDACLTEFFQYITDMIEKKMGGSYGDR